MEKRNFKRINLLGLDFYVDWLEVDGEFSRIICVKDVHGGRNFVYRDLVCAGEPLEILILRAIGIELKEAPEALGTEQPKEETNGKKTKVRSKRS